MMEALEASSLGDVDGDGELWAAEALRILQYVSGAVGSMTIPQRVSQSHRIPPIG